jgi:hypothetical protein
MLAPALVATVQAFSVGEEEPAMTMPQWIIVTEVIPETEGLAMALS